jgi:hypothetical protein
VAALHVIRPTVVANLRGDLCVSYAIDEMTDLKLPASDKRSGA